MEVHVVASAKVIEVIGYIAWQYTKEHRQPLLKKTVESYSLYMGKWINIEIIDYFSFSLRLKSVKNLYFCIYLNV